MTFDLTAKLMKYLLLAIACLSVVNVQASEEFGAASKGIFNDVEILPVEDAFVLQVLRHKDKLEVLWQIQPKHYLYRHRLGVKGSERLGKPQIPAGEAKTDEFFGDVEVYYEGLVLEVPLSGDLPETIQVEFQGCADAGICYPPQKREFTL